MTVTTTRPILLAGVNLQTMAYNIEILDGFYGKPRRRGRNLETPYLDGAYSHPQKFYGQRPLVMRMGVYPHNVNGVVTYDSPFEHLYENIDTLLGLFHSDTLLTLTRTMPDGAGTKTRTLEVESIREVVVQGKTPQAVTLAVELVAPRPFWSEQPKVTTLESGIVTTRGFNIVTGGNAPIGDAIITIDCTSAGSNPSLEIDSDSSFVTYASTMSPGDEVVIDLAARSFTYNTARADAAIQRNRAWFLRFPANTASLGMTFDSSSGTYNLTIERYDKWF